MGGSKTPCAHPQVTHQPNTCLPGGGDTGWEGSKATPCLPASAARRCLRMQWVSQTQVASGGALPMGLPRPERGQSLGAVGPNMRVWRSGDCPHVPHSQAALQDTLGPASAQQMPASICLVPVCSPWPGTQGTTIIKPEQRSARGPRGHERLLSPSEGAEEAVAGPAPSRPPPTPIARERKKKCSGEQGCERTGRSRKPMCPRGGPVPAGQEVAPGQVWEVSRSPSCEPPPGAGSRASRGAEGDGG